MTTTDSGALTGFINALDAAVDGALLVLNDGSALLKATNVIETILAEGIESAKAEIEAGGVDQETRMRLATSLEKISQLETKAVARITWSEDFESHLRLALDAAPQKG